MIHYLISSSSSIPQQQPPFYGYYIGQLAGAFSEELEDFVGAKLYCPHALADGIQYIWIREKTLELSTVLVRY